MQGKKKVISLVTVSLVALFFVFLVVFAYMEKSNNNEELRLLSFCRDTLLNQESMENVEKQGKLQYNLRVAEPPLQDTLLLIAPEKFSLQHMGERRILIEFKFEHGHAKSFLVEYGVTSM